MLPDSDGRLYSHVLKARMARDGALGDRSTAGESLCVGILAEVEEQAFPQEPPMTTLKASRSRIWSGEMFYCLSHSDPDKIV